MFNLFVRLFYKQPKYLKDIWYNLSAHNRDEKYPVIFDENKKYIPCKVGLTVVMNRTKSGKDVFYKVIKVYRSPGGDWLYDSDNITCDLKFSHIRRKQLNK